MVKPAHIKQVFIKTNGYPPHLVTSLLRKAKEKSNAEPSDKEDTREDSTEPKLLMMKVPYAGKTGESIVESLKKTLKRNLPSSLECWIVQTGTKLSTRFNIKDKVDKNHLSNFIYRRKCRNKRCKDSYVGETARRRTVRTGEHGGRTKTPGYSSIPRRQNILEQKMRISRFSQRLKVTGENGNWQKPCL